MNNSHSETANVPRAARWNPWPVAIIAFFAISIVGFVVFIWFCNRHPADLVATDYYEQEIRYQSQIDRVRNAQQEALGASVTYNAKTRSIIVEVPGFEVASHQGSVHLYRPSSVKLDRQLELRPDASGKQQIDAAALAPGLWQVRVSWTAGKTEYYIDRKIVVESSTSQT